MSRKRKLSAMSERCRICLVDHGCMSNLFDESLLPKVKDLASCTSIDIKQEQNLPEIICHVCLYKLDMWNEFKKQFVRSNEMLLNHLDSSILSDNASKRKCIDGEHGEESLSDDAEKKKTKSDVPPLIPLEFASVDLVADQTTLKEMYISEDDVTSSKDSSQKIQAPAEVKKEAESKNEDQGRSKPLLIPMKVKPLMGKRGRTTERRKASTKRWVARKKALLAAIGESASDTDSVMSDDTQLSPVQKARAKTNADKEAERQKRIARALKNLEANMTGKYGIKHDNDAMAIVADTDSDTRRTRSMSVMHANAPSNDDKSPALKPTTNNSVDKNKAKSSPRDATDKDRSVVVAAAKQKEQSVREDAAKNGKTDTAEETFTPHSIKSELELGDATYIVTSTLIIAEPHYLNKAQLNNLSKDGKTLIVDEASPEKNTDIIDAVQLRRIHPVASESSDKRSVERCLNIEVEGTELEALKRVQIELAGFVEKEMRNRLFGTSNAAVKAETPGNARKSSYQRLDQQLKNIVERAIRKNFETSMMNSPTASCAALGRSSTTVSETFARSATTSARFQPKVVIKRLDVARESKLYRINNAHALQRRARRGRPSGPFSMTSHKRQSVPPLKYNDYSVSIVDSESNLSEDEDAPAAKEAVARKPEACAPSKKPQQTTPAAKETVPEKKRATDDASESTDRDNGKSRSLEPSSVVHVNVELPIEKHMCGVCGRSFGSRGEVEAHVRSHKTDTGPAARPNKHKMMRCKRCHEIVEARLVKAHVCRSTKQAHKCYVCNSTFRTEKLLVRHLESHDRSEFSIENVAKLDAKNSSSAVQGVQSGGSSKGESSQVDRAATNADATRAECDNKSTAKPGKQEAAKGAAKARKTYTCFLCDKIFTDGEVLKDHLQKHCDDMSEDDQSMGKEQYQCAICGESVESEDALEAHVEKHLFDDEDDNPNLITIGADSERPKETSYSCGQCAERFDSAMLLEMHMQAHEEEAAIAEWEKQGMKAYEYQCMICDEFFELEEELSEHLDVHNGNALVCQLCDKPFSTLEQLQEHVATH